MGFPNTRAQAPVTNIDVKQEKQKIENDLAFLRTQHEKEKSFSSKIEGKEAELVRLESLCAEKETELVKTTTSITAEQAVLDGILAEIELAKAKIEKVDSYLVDKGELKSQLDSQINNLEQMVGTLESSIAAKKSELESLGGSHAYLVASKTALVAEIADLEALRAKEVSKAKEELVAVRSEETKKTQEELDALDLAKSAKARELDTLNKELSQVDAALVLKNQEKSSLELYVQEMRSSIKQEEANSVVKIEAAEKEGARLIAEAIAGDKDRVLALEVREGGVSDRETWLTEKEKMLRDIHAELERFHGKKIQIVFPK